MTQEQMWQGRLPSPKALAEFQELVPDAPERIFRQWEDESTHRRQYEIRALEASIRRDTRGQYGAIAFAVGSLGLAALAMYFGEPWIALVIGSGTIGSVVGAFLYQRRETKTSKS